LSPGVLLRDAFAHHWKRMLAAVAGLAVALLVVGSAELHGAVNGVFAAVRDVILAQGGGGKLAFVALSALSAMVAFFSSAVLVPVGVVAWGPATTLLLLWAGWLAGGMCAYAAGRFLGRRVVLLLVREDQVRAYERRLSGRAPFLAVLLFQLALPSELPGYLVGMLRYRFGAYVVALALAELPYAAGAVFLGDSFVRGDHVGIVVAGVALIGASAAGIAAWHRANGRAGARARQG